MSRRLVALSLMTLSAQAIADAPARPTPGTARPEYPAPLRFTGPEAPWPPAPAGRKNERILTPGPELTGSVTEELHERLRVSIPKHPGVRALLGERFALISVDEQSAPKGAEVHGTKLLLTFFSHSNNQAVLVKTSGIEVLELERRLDVQPATGMAEVTRAVTLAGTDPRLRDKVKGMGGGAIVVIPRAGQPGYGHRLLYVTFAKKVGLTPLYSANVDLTDDKVLSAGTADTERQ